MVNYLSQTQGESTALSLSEIRSIHTQSSNSGYGTIIGASIGVLAVLMHRSGALGQKAGKEDGSAKEMGLIVVGGLVGFLTVDRRGVLIPRIRVKRKKATLKLAGTWRATLLSLDYPSHGSGIFGFVRSRTTKSHS